MYVTHKLRPMDFIHPGVAQRVDVLQDDKYSRNLEVALTQNGIAWIVPDDTVVMVRYRKSDGKGGNYDTLPDGTIAYTIAGNVLTVALAPQVCTAPGMVQMAIGLFKGGAEINTFAINIMVHPTPGIDVLSDDYIKVSFLDRLEQMLQDASTALDDALDALAAANDANALMQETISKANTAADKANAAAGKAEDALSKAPSIGQNGNWYIGTEDSGVPATGPQGPKGDPGTGVELTAANIKSALGYTPASASQIPTDEHINELINAALGVIENGTY